MNDNEPTPINGATEEQTTEEEIVIIHVTQDSSGGFDIGYDTDASPIILAGIAWYLERMASLGLQAQFARIAQQQQQEQQPPRKGIYVPQGFTQDHKKGQN